MLARSYLLLALLGAVVPFLFFIDFFAEYGIHVPSFIAALFANGAAGALPRTCSLAPLFFGYSCSPSAASQKTRRFPLSSLS